MDIAVTYEAAKTGAEMVSALAKLATEAKKSKNPSLQELLEKLRIEARNIARGLDQNLDEIQGVLINQKIEPKMTLRQADEAISWWRLDQRLLLRSHVRRFTRLAGAVRDLYADVEAAFLCAQGQEALVSSVKSAYDVREKINSKLTDKTPIEEITKVLRDTIGDALKILDTK